MLCGPPAGVGYWTLLDFDPQEEQPELLTAETLPSRAAVDLTVCVLNVLTRVGRALGPALQNFGQ